MLSYDVLGTVFENSTFSVLLKFSRLSRNFFEQTQKYIFNNYTVHYNKKIELYSIHLTTSLNNYEDLDNDDVTKLSFLRNLDLSKNNKIDFIDSHKNLKFLSHLNLFRNTKIDDEMIKNLTSLYSLDLSHEELYILNEESDDENTEDFDPWKNHNKITIKLPMIV